VRRTFKYRLYPTRLQCEALDAQVNEACRLYNAALDERRRPMHGISIRYHDQANQLKAIRAATSALPIFGVPGRPASRQDVRASSSPRARRPSRFARGFGDSPPGPGVTAVRSVRGRLYLQGVGD
jgi:hypothetical protein